MKAIQWGRSNEKNAIETFEKQTNLKVKPTGIWLHRCGFLGASPDGLICDDASSIIEIKCPYKYRAEKSLEECLSIDKGYLLWYDTNSKQYIINNNHDYYHQIQGLLHILEKECCYAIIWTPQEVVISKILKCEDWKGNINLLQDFYFEQYVKNITQ